MRTAMRLASVTALLFYCSTATARLSEQHRLQQIQSPVTGDVRYRVPGNNNATFGATPLKDQLFDIQFLDVTPMPIVSDELYYMYLFGLFWPDHSSNPTQADLDNATLSFTFSIIYADGSQDVGSPYTIPLRTTLINRFQHMGIRNEDGLPTDRMSLGVYGENDIVADGWIYKQYVVSGNWTMRFDARIPDGRCLFDFSMTQWVDGDLQHHHHGIRADWFRENFGGEL
ncbi:hypothetical protein LTR95_010749 [Oleoguttula sp. CCFEE 5521]